MSCNCTCTKRCGCVPVCNTTSACVQENCTEVCAALVVSNSWNIPACGNSAVLSIPGLTTVLIGTSIYNPGYGWFRITGFDSVNGQLTVINDCVAGNSAPGTVVPAGTLFIFNSPPATLNTNFLSVPLGYSQALTGVEAAMVFDGGAQASVTLTTAGTYYVTAVIGFAFSAATTTGVLITTTLKRTNNTPSNLRIISNQGLNIAFTAYSGDYEAFIFQPFMYTTLNSSDILDFSASIQTGTISAGDMKAVGSRTFINAIKYS